MKGLKYEELDDTYYYIFTCKSNEDICIDAATDIIKNMIVVGMGYPHRLPVVVVEDGFSKNKFLVVWEFGVIGAVEVGRVYDS